MARKSIDCVTHVKKTASKCHVIGVNSQMRQIQSHNATKASSVVKKGAQHNFSLPVAHPKASNLSDIHNVRDVEILGVEQVYAEVDKNVDSGPGLNPAVPHKSGHNDNSGLGLNPDKQAIHHQITSESDPECRGSVHAACTNDKRFTDQCIPLYDVNNVGVEEKFVNTIMHFKQIGDQINIGDCQLQIFQKWREQSDFDFGFIPLGEQQMPTNLDINVRHTENLIEIHEIVKNTKKPNFMQARIPVTSQLNVEVWQELLKDYWDQQLLQLLRFGFPLDFNRNSQLHCEGGNHSSAIQYPKDVEAYIQEETSYGGILGPFKENPIESSHTSPFMTRNKPNSDRPRVIIDLSWPLGASVNAGIDKDTYLGTPLALTFPTVDVITTELKRLGRGAHLYKIDVSRAFRHVRIDPGDYDLLGLHWRDAYVDTYLPFGTRHGSQIFQRLRDAVRHIMHQRGFASSIILMITLEWASRVSRVRHLRHFSVS